MSDPYLGEVKVTSFNFPPRGWAFCNGQLMAINQNQALYSILGTTYGGDGVTTFALPNLQGRIPLHMGNGYPTGQQAGEASHTLTVNELPTHMHPPVAQTTATTPGTSPAGSLWASSTTSSYGPSANVNLAPGAVANAGGNQPHENQAPYLVLTFIIALQGIFPSRN